MTIAVYLVSILSSNVSVWEELDIELPLGDFLKQKNVYFKKKNLILTSCPYKGSAEEEPAAAEQEVEDFEEDLEEEDMEEEEEEEKMEEE